MVLAKYTSHKMTDAEIRGALKLALEGRVQESGVTVDKPDSAFLDDAFDIRQKVGGGWRVKISIADVAAMVPSGSQMDQVAERYAQNNQRRLFQRDFVIKGVSLLAGKTRPAITYAIDVDAQGGVESYDIYRSAFRNRRRYSYKDLDRPFVAAGDDLHDALRFLQRRREKSASVLWQGLTRAFNRVAPLVSARDLQTPPVDSFPQSLISTLKVLLAEVNADFLRRHDMPAYYHPLKTLAVNKDGNGNRNTQECERALDDIICLMATDRELSGVDASAPIRRYDDLMMQRQVVAALEGRAPVYSESMLEVMLESSRWQGLDHLIFAPSMFRDEDDRTDTTSLPSPLYPGALPLHFRQATQNLRDVGNDSPSLATGNITFGGRDMTLFFASVEQNGKHCMAGGKTSRDAASVAAHRFLNGDRGTHARVA